MLEEKDLNAIEFDEQIETLKKNMEELARYYRITKLEKNDNTALVIKMLEELSKRVTKLERKTAY